MNAEMQAATAEDQDVNGSQATAVSHATRVEALRACVQCIAKEKVYTQDQHQRVRKTKMQGS